MATESPVLTRGRANFRAIPTIAPAHTRVSRTARSHPSRTTTPNGVNVAATTRKIIEWSSRCMKALRRSCQPTEWYSEEIAEHRRRATARRSDRLSDGGLSSALTARTTAPTTAAAGGGTVEEAAHRVVHAAEAVAVHPPKGYRRLDL